MSRLNKAQRQAKKAAAAQAKIDAAESTADINLTRSEWKAWDAANQHVSKEKATPNQSFPVRSEDYTDSYGGDELTKITPRPAQLINTQESELISRGDYMGKAGNLYTQPKTEDYTKQTPAEKYDQPFIAFGDKEFDPADYPNYPHVSEDGTRVMTDEFYRKTEKQNNPLKKVDTRPAVNPITGEPLTDATKANRDQAAQATSKVQNTDYKNGKVDSEETDQNSDVDFETPPKNNTSTDLSENATETKQEDSLDNKDGDGKDNKDGDGKDGGKKKSKGIIPRGTTTVASNTGTTITPPSVRGGGATPNQTRGLANKNWGLA